ncbi:hypothetical protein ACO22_04206 [Paracoccidioides brasiliensis]|uniref:Uncharacterized protein n=1 Tax=Paracoccidioides brasiliensis TaxID=121759 RepID=A0A1D2JDU2_PARBR|nr:hypothetical protein ACO22_04206 [Paracoccidioides brasiliensis]ODH46474.1 hypothetical protein GX48_07451 [Paracoccidioides brasiliensis]
MNTTNKNPQATIIPRVNDLPAIVTLQSCDLASSTLKLDGAPPSITISAEPFDPTPIYALEEAMARIKQKLAIGKMPEKKKELLSAIFKGKV